MGIHYIHPGRASNPEIDPLRPEMLPYVPVADGMKLVGVEYWVADAGQPRASVLGLPLDGPIDGYDPGMPMHYDLYGWLWRYYPRGMFAPFNPSIDC